MVVTGGPDRWPGPDQSGPRTGGPSFQGPGAGGPGALLLRKDELLLGGEGATGPVRRPFVQAAPGGSHGGPKRRDLPPQKKEGPLPAHPSNPLTSRSPSRRPSLTAISQLMCACPASVQSMTSKPCISSKCAAMSPWGTWSPHESGQRVGRRAQAARCSRRCAPFTWDPHAQKRDDRILDRGFSIESLRWDCPTST